MKKSAFIQWETLRGLLLSLVAVAVIVFVLFVWKGKVLAQTPKDVCRQSVDIAALSNLRGLDLSADVNCQTQYEELKTKDKDIIKKKLANKMADCWWQFGEGQKELFSTPKTYCVVCSVTSFENKDQKIRGFSKYLMDNNVPGKRIKYIDYFNGFETSEADRIVGKIDPEILAGLENEELNTSKRYATIFLYAKGKDAVKQIARHLFMQTPEGKVGGIAAGIAGIGGGIAAVSVLGLFVSNPVGWAVGFGLAVFGIVETIFLRFSSDNAPEWAAFVVFREYTSENIQELGCMELPSKQK